MFCRQSSAVEGCAGPPRYHGATLFSGANAVSALYFISWHKFITFVLYALVRCIALRIWGLENQTEQRIIRQNKQS